MKKRNKKDLCQHLSMDFWALLELVLYHETLDSLKLHHSGYVKFKCYLTKYFSFYFHVSLGNLPKWLVNRASTKIAPKVHCIDHVLYFFILT